jgi:hypothetical protein|tara:strand:- start:2014 stop:2265 length:252 start_codon:yes stop_codon:yes gene_type:complete
MARNYAKEYANYHARPEQIKRRSARNKARRLALKQGRVKIGDGLDIHHRDGNPLNNKSNNLRAMRKSNNRSFARTKTARKKKF